MGPVCPILSHKLSEDVTVFASTFTLIRKIGPEAFIGLMSRRLHRYADAMRDFTQTRLVLVRVKIKRAEKHHQDLEAPAEAFRDAYMHVVGTETDAKTLQAQQYFAKLPISGIGERAGKRIGFPIFDTAKEYKARRTRKMKGARKAAIKAIDKLKPYKGGNPASVVS